MKAKFIRILSALFCFAIILTVVSLTRIELHGASPVTLLFHNDRVWTQNSTLPAEELHSVYYAPILLFVQLPSVEARFNKTLNTFIITHGEKYLSFDITSNFAINQNKERMYLKTMEFYGERYVPVEAVCEALDLGLEKYVDPTTSNVALRVTDGAQTKTLESLAKSKTPGYFPETTVKITETTAPNDTTSKDTTAKDTTTKDTTAKDTTAKDTTAKDTTAKDTTAKDTTPVLSYRTVYITFDGAPGRYTYDILSVLSRYNCRATFFVGGDGLQEQAQALSAIAAGGHAIALGIPDGNVQKFKTADEMTAYIEAQNDILFRLIKQKTHIVQRAEGIDRAAVELFAAQGYMLWGANVTVSASLTPAAATSLAVNGIWNNEIVLLRFTEAENTAKVLEGVLKFISQNRDVCEVRIISAALEN